MNCREAKNYIFAERDGALGEAQRAALVSHLASCTDCQAVRTDLEQCLTELHATAANVRVPDADIEWQKVRRALRAEEEPAVRRRSFAGWLALPAAAAAAVAIGLYVRTGSPTGSDISAGDRVATVAPTTPGTATAPSPSAVVYVDDQSGWTFVWATDADTDQDGRHI